MGISWDNDPSFHAHLPAQVSSPRTGQTLIYWLLGDHAGKFLHFTKIDGGRKPVPCDDAQCKLCPDPRRYWKAWVPALMYSQTVRERWVYVAAELTELAFRELLQSRQPDQFRNTVVSMTRGATNSHVRLTVLESPPAGLATLPPAFDVRIVVERMWGLRRAEKGHGGTPTAPVLTLPPIMPLPFIGSAPVKPVNPREKVMSLKAALAARQGVQG